MDGDDDSEEEESEAVPPATTHPHCSASPVPLLLTFSSACEEEEVAAMEVEQIEQMEVEEEPPLPAPFLVTDSAPPAADPSDKPFTEKLHDFEELSRHAADGGPPIVEIQPEPVEPRRFPRRRGGPPPEVLLQRDVPEHVKM